MAKGNKTSLYSGDWHWQFIHKKWNLGMVGFASIISILGCEVGPGGDSLPQLALSSWKPKSFLLNLKQGKSGGFDSCDRPNNLTHIGFK